MADSDEEAQHAHERRLENLKTGQGVGRRGGFGQLHDMTFQPLFKNAIEIVMKRNLLPENNVVDAETTITIVEDLHARLVSYFKSAWARPDFWPIAYGDKMQWCSVSDTLRKYVHGIYPRQTLPQYFEEVIYSISDERWRSFFTQRLLVKHNHLNVSIALAGRQSTIKLMDLDGRITGPHIPKKPYPPQFFDKIKLLPLNHQVSEAEASDGSDGAVLDGAAAGAREDGANRRIRLSKFRGDLTGTSEISRPHGASILPKSPPSASGVGTRKRRKCAS